MAKTTTINPDFVLDSSNRKDYPLFYEGDHYQIMGPLRHPADSMGVLLPRDLKMALDMMERRKKYKEVFQEGSVDLMNILYVVQNQPIQAMVEMPPANYVCLESLTKAKEKSLTQEILRREWKRGVYAVKPEARDFWIDPATKRLFLVAVEKLK